MSLTCNYALFRFGSLQFNYQLRWRASELLLAEAGEVGSRIEIKLDYHIAYGGARRRQSRLYVYGLLFKQPLSGRHPKIPLERMVKIAAPQSRQIDQFIDALDSHVVFQYECLEIERLSDNRIEKLRKLLLGIKPSEEQEHLLLFQFMEMFAFDTLLEIVGKPL
jgi:hypothetical protein